MARDTTTAIKCGEIGKNLANTHVSGQTVTDLHSTADVIMGYATQAAVRFGEKFLATTAPHLTPEDPDYQTLTRKYWQEFMSALGEQLAAQTQARTDDLMSQGAV